MRIVSYHSLIPANLSGDSRIITLKIQKYHFVDFIDGFADAGCLEAGAAEGAEQLVVVDAVVEVVAADSLTAVGHPLALDQHCLHGRLGHLALRHHARRWAGHRTQDTVNQTLSTTKDTAAWGTWLSAIMRGAGQDTGHGQPTTLGNTQDT